MHTMGIFDASYGIITDIKAGMRNIEEFRRRKKFEE
jgi:hypothetical protein